MAKIHARQKSFAFKQKEQCCSYPGHFILLSCPAYFSCCTVPKRVSVHHARGQKRRVYSLFLHGFHGKNRSISVTILHSHLRFSSRISNTSEQVIAQTPFESLTQKFSYTPENTLKIKKRFQISDLKKSRLCAPKENKNVQTRLKFSTDLIAYIN